MRQRLRAATKTDHQRVDELFSRFDLADRTGLGRFLAAHYMALSLLEPAFEGLLSLPWPRRVPLLTQDLEALGQLVPRACLDVPDLSNRERRLGAAYVVAGSHFGQKVLVRQWQRSQDEQVQEAGSYLSDEALACSWRELVPTLEKTTGDRARSEVERGARVAFEIFLRAGRLVSAEALPARSRHSA